jgi:uncharacterized membrane protein
MEFIKVFIIAQVIFLVFQFFYPLKLESYQYCELVFGSFFIIIFFGVFGSVLTLDMMKPQKSILNNSSLFATFYAIWFYITKKLSNSINSDKNGVIYF